MKVLFVYDTLSSTGGGSQMVVAKYIQHLATYGIEYRLLTSSLSRAWLEKDSSIPLDNVIFNRSIDLSFVFPGFHPSLFLSTQAMQEILTFSPDIVQLNEPSLLDWGLITLAKKHNIRLCGFYHTNYELFQPGYLFRVVDAYRKSNYEKVDLILCPSTAMVKKVQQTFFDKTVVKVPYPIDDAYFQPVVTTNKKNNNLLYVGRLPLEKKIPFIFSVLQQLPDTYTLTVVGDGKEKEQLVHSVRRLNIAKRVTFAGRQDPLYIRKLLSSVFLTIYPSVSETFGLVYIESLVSGVPLIVADYPTSREIIPHNCALFMNNYDEKQWADAIIALSQNDKKYQGYRNVISKNRHYFDQYNEVHATKALASIYTELVRSHKCS